MSSTTEEQKTIIDHVNAVMANDNIEEEIVLVNAVAGSGKTYLLTQIVANVPHSRGIYISYNKSIATEAATKFPASISCLTANALAYRNTVKAMGLRVGTFGYRDIQESWVYSKKADIVDCIKEFCLSAYLDFDTYASENKLSVEQIKYCKKYLQLMSAGTIECSHDFYMKVFHKGLASGHIKFPKFDFLLLDESGDLNEVTLEIFRHFPAKVKIAVGDNNQNIYGFNHTINAFEVLKGQGTYFNLSKSFRVSEKIASRIQKFCNQYVDKDMVFTGFELQDETITTRAFIARTNAGLIATMMQLNTDKTPYKLIRSADQIFKIPLMLCGMKYQGRVLEPQYTHLQADFDEWHEDFDVKSKFKSPLSYIQSLYPQDITLQFAIRLIMNKGVKLIFETYELAKQHEKSKANLYLSTAHSSKGLEFDEVILVNDMNVALEEIIPAIASRAPIEEELQELNLYYVACSRARKSLINAKHL